MLRILAPRVDNSGRTYSDLYRAPQPPSAMFAGDQKQRRTVSMGSSVARGWEPIDLKPTSAHDSVPTPQASTQTTGAISPNISHAPTRSFSVSMSVPNRTNSISSSKVSALIWQDYDVPRLTKTPWEVERHKRNSTWRRSGVEIEFPAHTFKPLPREVYDCIITQLEQIHLQQEQPCPACYLRDLCSLSLTSRAWDKIATMQMYRKVYLLANDDHLRSPKLKIRGASRLKLLRRTLRERPTLGRNVHELHLPDFQTLYQRASIEREEIVNLVASLVMACPSLERLVGFHIPFNRSFDRLSYALATRSKLRERVWLLSEPEDHCSDEEDDDKANGYYLEACDPTERFLDLNSAHPLLTTLVLHRTSDEMSPTLNFRAIIGTFRQLPMLQNLLISGLPATSFTNLTLNALPPRLQSLRLENLPGINDKGLQRFATSHISTCIERLTLINLELSSLITITSILSANSTKLKQFSLVQYRTPDLNSRAPTPSLSCPSLRYIHLEFRSQAGPAIDPFSPNPRQSVEFPFTNSEPISCLATTLLAAGIKDGAFPSLRRVRIPHDPQGVIQALCRPRATALLPSDTSIFTRPLHKSGTTGYAIRVDAPVSLLQSPRSQEDFLIEPLSPRADSAIDTPMFDVRPSHSVLSPAKIRLAAQARILAARKLPFITVRVYGPEDDVRIDTAIGGYIGDISSNIVYDLEPDKGRWPGNRDQSGPPQPEWITGIEDLMDGRTPPNDRSRERSWGKCGHQIGGRVGCNTVRVEELF